ncbi:MAG: ABC transporter permease [Actinomycetota bacterium]|nr:ABC transporter permease [Actinomycetota bacterium]
MQSSSEVNASSTTPGTSRARKGTSRLRWSSLPTVARRSILLVAMVLLWQLYVSVSGVSPLLVSSPAKIAEAFWEGWASGELAAATLVTLEILGLGMLVGMCLAAVLTTFATWTRIGEDVLVLLTSMLNPLPAIAILPLAILWFGLSPAALVFVIANAVTWPIAINVSTGFRTVNPTILMVGRNLGLRGFKLVKDVLMPAALPHTISGLKTGWAFGWRTIIAAELVFGVAGGGGGLGYFINDSRYFLRIPDVFAGLVTIALIGIALDVVFTWIERRTVIKWGMKSGT